MLYGSQYAEIKKRGGNVSKGRLNGNLLLSAVIMIYLFLIFVCFNLVSDDFADVVTRISKNTFGGTGGKTIGRIIALPLLASIYLPVAFILGTKSKYEEYYKAYKNSTEAERKNGKLKMAIVFFVGLGLLTAISISSLFL